MNGGHHARRVLFVVTMAATFSAHTAYAQRVVDQTFNLQDLDPTLQEEARRLIEGDDQSAIDPPTPINILDSTYRNNQALEESIRNLPAAKTDTQDTPPSKNPPPSLTETLLRTDSEIREAYRQVLLARYKRETEKYVEIRNELRWSHIVGRVIFGFAHLVLVIGLFLSVREFFDARRLRKESDEAAERAVEIAGVSPAQAAAENEVRISLEGIALKTSLNGLAFLAVAVGFYYLYLKFVYPITVVGTP